MANDLSYLSRRMFQYASAIVADVNEFTIGVALAVDAAVIQGTPVDVGTARSNWIVRLGSPFRFVYRAYSPHPSRWRPPYSGGGGRSESANASAALTQARAVLARRQIDQTIYITNNIPYIGRLNQGHSNQSPAGFVQRGVLQGTQAGITGFRWPNIRRLG